MIHSNFVSEKKIIYGENIELQNLGCSLGNFSLNWDINLLEFDHSIDIFFYIIKKN